MMGVDRSYVSGLELGQRNVTILSLWQVAEALGADMASFFQKGASRAAGKKAP
jgi:transcriptional regulator with XRE-family HTH domain